MSGPSKPLERIRALLAEKRRREIAAREAAAKLAERFTRIAGELRAPFHEHQQAFFTKRAGQQRNRAACTTRQSGKTSGGTRETLARALETPNVRWVYVISTREEALKRCWRNDTDEGWTQLVRRFGLEEAANRKAFEKGKGDCLIDSQWLTIEFRNGSQLDIFAADDEKSTNKLRGVQKNGIWVDEAQQFPGLAKFCEDVVDGCLAVRRGETVLTGTPSEFLDGLFYDVTRDDDLSARKPGWDVCAWSCVDNPVFGTTYEERYENAIASKIREKKLDPDNLPPGFIREWLGKWVATEARYVYRVQTKTDDELCFAPTRTKPLPSALEVIQQLSSEPIAWYDHAAALADLPSHMRGTRRRIEWSFGLGIDFGFSPDPFAISLIAWSWDLPDVYEMWSWKQVRLYPTWQKKILDWFWREVPGIERMVADPGGAQAKAEIEGWAQFTDLPIEAADKAQKRLWIDLRNDEISTGRYHYRAGSVLLDEHRHLMWRLQGSKLLEHADRQLQDGRIPGNHASDADLYITRTIVGLRAEQAPKPKPKYGSPEWAAEQEERMEVAAGEAALGDVPNSVEGQEEDWSNYL